MNAGNTQLGMALIYGNRPETTDVLVNGGGTAGFGAAAAAGRSGLNVTLLEATSKRKLESVYRVTGKDLIVIDIESVKETIFIGI